MNTPIVRLYGLLLLLFAALVGFTSYWAVFDADALKDNPENRRPLIVEQTVKRGHDQDRRRGDGGARASGGGRQAPGLRPPLSAGIAVRKPGRLQLRRASARPGSSAPRTACWPASATSSPRSSTRSAASPGGRQRHPDDRRQRPAGGHPGASVGDRLDRRGRRGAAARWWPSTPRPARSRRWPRCPATTRTRLRIPRYASSWGSRAPVRRSSTVPPRAPIRRARP